MKVHKHTPGPWTWAEDAENDPWVQRVVRNGDDLDATPLARDIGNRSDAQLIAAAPEILQYLVVLDDWIKEMGLERRHYRDGIHEDVMLKVRQVIAKAGGRNK